MSDKVKLNITEVFASSSVDERKRELQDRLERYLRMRLEQDGLLEVPDGEPG